MSDEQIGAIFDKIGIDVNEMELTESVEELPWFMQENKQIAPGTYELTNEVVSPMTGETIGYPTNRVIVDENTTPIGSVFGASIYRVRHVDTHQEVYVTARDIKR